MSEHDEDLRGIFRAVAEGANQRPGAEGKLLVAARRRRLMTAGMATLCVLVLIGGIAGAAVFLEGREPIEPAPRPTLPADLRADDLASMSVTEIAAALFVDRELQDAVPPLFTLSDIVRKGPSETNHDYATVGVRMTGPVDYARVIFFVHPNDTAAHDMYERELDMAASRFRDAHRSEGFRGWRPYALANAAPDTKCAAGIDDLFSCLAWRGHVVMLTQSSAGGPGLGPKLSEAQLEAAETLARSFGSYMNRVYPAPAEVANVTNVVEVQRGTIRMEVDPPSPLAGTIPHALLINDTQGRIGYGHSYRLERRVGSGWQALEAPSTCMFTQELILVPPAQDVRHVIGAYNRDCEVVPLRSDTYRLTKTIELESGKRLALSAVFGVREVTDGFTSIDEAVAFLERRLDIEIALPGELPPDIRLAPAEGQAVTVDREGDVVSGRLNLRYGKKGILIFDFGRAAFDGCGGDGAVEVDIAGQSGLMLAKDEYPWTQIIWPAEPGQREATYGIYGSLRSAAMLELARSMSITFGRGPENSEGCL